MCVCVCVYACVCVHPKAINSHSNELKLRILINQSDFPVLYMAVAIDIMNENVLILANSILGAWKGNTLLHKRKCVNNSIPAT